ncbi:ubiquinol-cytochrome-c reductase complex assembly factor 3 [Polyodon spathula]|uniref:ubiquinol-cytochrome-c reductase complex assembly factor 3 n=1 Tax=Polyodon spathula TaxID=7913 RepID=UPI001B7E5AA0|nr:ubiquinol-cytochrome-c reductase complex assembly factor 3 [Polyodon spathula]
MSIPQSPLIVTLRAQSVLRVLLPPPPLCFQSSPCFSFRVFGAVRSGPVRECSVNMSSIKWITNAGLVFGAAGTACGFWMITSPGEQRKKNILKTLPEANPLRMEETRLLTALQLRVLKEAAETDENITRRYSK